MAVNTKPQVVGNKLKPILSPWRAGDDEYGRFDGGGYEPCWRQRLIMKAIEQLLRDVLWSRKPILLFLDNISRNGRRAATLAQSVPVTAGVCVTTPQVVALDDSSVRLICLKLHIPIAGVIENMSGFICRKITAKSTTYLAKATEEVAELTTLKFFG